MFIRPTIMAAAFVAAAEKSFDQKGRSSFAARRVAVNCDKTGFALIREYDKRPLPAQNHPRVLKDTEVSASDNTEAVKKAVMEGITEVMDKLVAGRKALLMDEEIFDEIN